MLQKKIWIPVLLVLIGFAIGGTFVGRHIASQEPVRVINVVTPEPVDRSESTPAETQPAPAAEGGHWHGDEWHAESHEPVLPSGGLQSDGVWYPDNYTPADIAADLAGLPAEPGEEYHRRAMKHAVNVYIQKHQKAYPDCAEKQAVIDDAKRFAAWQLADQAYMDKYRQLTTERDRSRNEMTRLLEKYNYSPPTKRHTSLNPTASMM